MMKITMNIEVKRWRKRGKRKQRWIDYVNDVMRKKRL